MADAFGEAEDGFEEGVGFGIGDGDLRGHGDFSPDACAAGFEFGFEVGEGVCLAAVFECDIEVVGADGGAVDLMAGEALACGEGFLDFRWELGAAGIVAGGWEVAGADDGLFGIGG